MTVKSLVRRRKWLQQFRSGACVVFAGSFAASVGGMARSLLPRFLFSRTPHLGAWLALSTDPAVRAKAKAYVAALAPLTAKQEAAGELNDLPGAAAQVARKLHANSTRSGCVLFACF